MSHTNGPWTFDSKSKEISSSMLLIAEICGPITAVDVQANAHLIAAAPELLEALKELADEYGETIGLCKSECNHLDCMKVNRALIAIEKAEGHE